MSTKDFFSSADANRYLSQSLVMYDNEPVWVLESSEDMTFSIYSTSSKTKQVKQINYLDNKNKFNFTPVPLGFVNRYEEGEDAVVLERIPLRRWKIGLSASNIVVTSPLQDEQGTMPSLIYSPFLANTIKGIFPSVKEILSELKHKDILIAFSRNFAVMSGSGDLYYKYKILGVRKPIGTIDQEGNFNLDEDVIYLKEKLKNDLR